MKTIQAKQISCQRTFEVYSVTILRFIPSDSLQFNRPLKFSLVLEASPFHSEMIFAYSQYQL
jgi:hypothetical protein